MKSNRNLQNKIIKIFFFLRSNFLSFSFFSIYGVLSNILSFFLFFTLTKFNIFEYKISYLISSLIINLINYFAYSKIFKSITNLVSMLKFSITQIIIGVTHLLLIIIMVETFKIDKYSSHLISNIFLAIILYLLYKYFVYSINEKNIQIK